MTGWWGGGHRHDCPESLRMLLKEPRYSKKKSIHYFKGTPLSREDLDRVKVWDASMIFVLADTLVTSTSSSSLEASVEEDRENIMRAAAL